MEKVCWKSVTNMANSIIGVSILAMPYCFAECGLILGTLTLMFIAFLTSYSCKILIKSAVVKNCKTYETLALSTFGQTGKFFTEICVIFMLFGSMVSYQQTLSDSCLIIVRDIIQLEDKNYWRYVILLILTLTIALPLSLSKKLDRLAGISAMSIVIYAFFSFYMFTYALQTIRTDENWQNNIVLWKLSGLFKIIPIYSMSFSCQTVLFVVYEESGATVERMNKTIDTATLSVFLIYLASGVFGYIAFCNTVIHGNVLTHIHDSIMFEVILFGFMYAVLVGYPFMVLPCRNCFTNLLLFENHKDIDYNKSKSSTSTSNYITFTIIIMTTITAILIPNIEFILSLTGSTTASIICYIVPALIHKNASSKQNDNRIVTEILLLVGLMLLFVCSINTIYQSGHHTKGDIPQEIKEFIEVKKEENADEINKLLADALNAKNGGDLNPNKLLKEIGEEKKLLEEQLKILNEIKIEIKNNYKTESAKGQTQQILNVLRNDLSLLSNISTTKVINK